MHLLYYRSLHLFPAITCIDGGTCHEGCFFDTFRIASLLPAIYIGK